MPESWKNIVIAKDAVICRFGADGFLQNAVIPSSNGTVYEAASSAFGCIRIALADGRELVPCCESSKVITETSDVTFVEFQEILWRTAAGETVSGFHLASRYEQLSSARAFVNAFSCMDTMNASAFNKFSLNFDLAAGAFSDAKCTLVPRPHLIDASQIQTFRSGHCLPHGESYRINGEITPGTSVNLRAGNGETAYFEITVEGANLIFGGNQGNFLEAIWKNSGDFHAKYSFIRETPCRNKPMHLFQWRNLLGLIVKTVDRVRRSPLFHIYPYFDNCVRYPADEYLENTTRCGTGTLIRHKNWRFDLQNNGIPFDAAEFRRTVDKAHRLGIRGTLYIRGNKVSAEDASSQRVELYLDKDRDCLYMDRDDPFRSRFQKEFCPDGRITLKNYLLRIESLRKCIGKDGVSFGHTGAGYSTPCCVSGILDGYLSAKARTV